MSEAFEADSTTYVQRLPEGRIFIIMSGAEGIGFSGDDGGRLQDVKKNK